MSSFFRLVWAVMVGIVVLNALVLTAVWWKWGREPSIEAHSILSQPIAGPILEYPAGGFASGIFASSAPTLHNILDNLAKAAVDDRIDGVLLTLNNPGAGYGMLEEIQAGIQKVRDAGKPVWAWSDNWATKDLLIASACDSFFVHPAGYIFLGGMYVERMYVGGALEKLGVEPNIHRIERYKSAAELVTRKDMSAEAREMTGWILGDIFPRVLESTAAGLGVEQGALLAAMERALPTVDELEAMGIVSGSRYWDEMKAALPRPKGKKEPRFVSGSTYSGVSAEDVGLKGKKRIAVIHAQGLITGSESGRDPFLGAVMGHASVRADLKTALDDKDVVGVVFRVDSGGGETIVSERIGRMVQVVDREKPVVVSMVDAAASGGYTISYRARSMIANQNTITGSIGSITGKFNSAGLYGKLGVHFDGVGVGPNADFYSGSRSWTEEENAVVSEEHWDGYQRWIADIASHRNMTAAEVDSLARGRVWTGAQAAANGLIDEIGGLDVAVLRAKEEAGLDAEDPVTLVHWPQPRGFLSELLGMEISTIPDVVAGHFVQKRLERMESLSRARLSLSDVPVP